MDSKWMTMSDIVVFDPKTIQATLQDAEIFGNGMVVQHSIEVKPSTIDRLKAFGDNEFQIVYVSSARSIAPEYRRIVDVLNMAHKKATTLEQYINTIRFKYSAAIYDKERLVLNSNVSLESIDSIETQESSCIKCKSIEELKKNLKEIKRTYHNEVNKTRLDLELNLQLVAKLQRENKKLKEHNDNLKEMNKLLNINR